MSQLSAYELEREANIARNRALLDELNIKEATSQLGLGSKKSEKQGAKPVQEKRASKRQREEVRPTRQSTRLRRAAVVDLNESPAKRRKRELEEEAARKKAEEERLTAEALVREARKPRHHDLELSVLGGEETSPDELSEMMETFKAVVQEKQSRRIGSPSDFDFDENRQKEDVEVTRLREALQELKVVARAKVTSNRIYSAAYHPEKTKDLILFGDKHGQLGIWEPFALPEEAADEDDEPQAVENGSDGRYWRLQPHWPATAKSSISCVKINPIDSHSIFTSAYDCTVRDLSLETGVSREIFSLEDTLISSIDLPPSGKEMWISDVNGGVSHIDLRNNSKKYTRWELSEQKIGCISINPVTPHILLTASNNRLLKLWDARQLNGHIDSLVAEPLTPPPSSPIRETRSRAQASPKPNAGLSLDTGRGQISREPGSPMAEFEHNKSVSSAYWGPRGREIVSTSYDDTLRIWDLGPRVGSQTQLKHFNPFSRIRHNCQTGRWLTVLRAQWSLNPNVLPHFTIGNMDHSLDIYTGKGELLARLSDNKRISAVQAVTCSHPGIVERAASGNASGRCVLWGNI